MSYRIYLSLPFLIHLYRQGAYKQFERVIPPPKVPRRQTLGLSTASTSFSSQNTRGSGPQRPAHANAPQQPESIKRKVTSLNPINPPKEKEVCIQPSPGQTLVANHSLSKPEPEVGVEEDPYAPVYEFLSHLDINLSGSNAFERYRV